MTSLLTRREAIDAIIEALERFHQGVLFCCEEGNEENPYDITSHLEEVQCALVLARLIKEKE